MTAWKDMTPKERAAHARSFIGKRKGEQLQTVIIEEGHTHTDADLGAAFAKMTQAERDKILRHPAIQTPRRTR